MKRQTLETRIRELLRPLSLDSGTRYTIRAHALTHDGMGWSSNDRWTIAADVDLADTLQWVRGRWRVFRANYAPRARVQDVDCIAADAFDTETVYLTIDAEQLAFLDIEATGPAAVLWDLIRDAEQIHPPDIRADLEKARRDFTLEEYPADLHAARLAALDFLNA